MDSKFIEYEKLFDSLRAKMIDQLNVPRCIIEGACTGLGFGVASAMLNSFNQMIGNKEAKS